MLTDIKLRKLKPRATVYRKADAAGLCIEISPSGAKLWRHRYRYNGKASMLSLGEYPASRGLFYRRDTRRRLQTGAAARCGITAESRASSAHTGADGYRRAHTIAPVAN
jgi:hypothetical protein